MNETEMLLIQAQDIARRTFENPSEIVVMDLFRRLCDEHDRSAWVGSSTDGKVVH